MDLSNLASDEILDETEIRWKLVSGLEVEHVSRNHLRRHYLNLVTVTEQKAVVWKHSGDGSHDLEEDQSCLALKAAWMSKTARRAIARAKFATAGGRPRGFQEIKASTGPVKKIDPEPPNRYRNIF